MNFSGVGNYVVQSVTINEKKRTLPTMSIFTKSSESLAELYYTFSAKESVEKVNFVMTDSTAHNLKVFDSVCEDLEAENSPNISDL